MGVGVGLGLGVGVGVATAKVSWVSCGSRSRISEPSATSVPSDGPAVRGASSQSSSRSRAHAYTHQRDQSRIYLAALICKRPASIHIEALVYEGGEHILNTYLQ